MSSANTRQTKQARLHAHNLAKIASNALETLVTFIENNEDSLTERAESTFSLSVYELEDMKTKLHKLSESYSNQDAPIYRGTIDRLGRVEIKCKQTGNLLHSFCPSDDVVEYLNNFHFALRDVNIEWHPEEFDRSKLS